MAIMTTLRLPAVEDFFIDLPKSILRTEIYGSPVHQDAEPLIAAAIADLNSYLDSEMRHSVGSYVLVIPTSGGARIVTSPGYCGGYIYSADGRTIATTTYFGIVKQSGVMLDEMSLCHFLNHAPKSSFNQLPISALFKDVIRLPPASVVEIHQGEITSFKSYIKHYARRERPKSFAQALDETMSTYANFFKRKGITPTLMFSGGVDSLVMYLSLRQMMDPADIRCVVMHHNKANGPERATPIARHVGMNLEVFDATVMNDDVSVAAITDMAEEDIIATASPHLAFLSKPRGGVILHGQNMDALANVNMTILQANKELGLLSAEKQRAELSDAQAALQQQTFIGNLPFTASYAGDKTYQALSQHFYQSLYKGSMRDPDPGGAGLVRGMISSAHPNLLLKARYPLKQLDILDRESNRLLPFIGKRPNHQTVDLLRFYGYSQLANKRMATLPLAGGELVSLAAMSGPIISYFLGRPRNLIDATRPKREIYAYAKSRANAAYSEMSAFQTGDVRHSEPIDERDVYLETNRSTLKEGRVLDLIEDTKIRSHVANMYKGIDVYNAEGSRYSRSRSRQLLNLELIIKRARK